MRPWNSISAHILLFLLLFPLNLWALDAQRRYEEAQGEPLRAETLSPYRILYVPGFLSDPSDLFKSRYFREQLDELGAVGLKRGEDFVRLASAHGYNGETTETENARAVARMIEASPRPLLVVSHSKGSLEMLIALVDHPELREKIAAWFSIQGAFGGSPVADSVTAKDWSRNAMRAILAIFSGSLEALMGLKTDRRQDYLRENDSEIRAVMNTVPLLAYRSHAPTESMHWSLRKVRDNFGAGLLEGANDGLMPLELAVLPGAYPITEAGPDHIDPVIASGERPFDRKRFHWASLSLMLEAARERGR